MKVLLVDPSQCWSGLNIALGYLAAMLKKKGHEVKVLNLTEHKKWKIEIIEKAFIRNYHPDLIGIALFYLDYFPVKRMIARIKSYYDKPIVIGGPQMLIEKEKILSDIPELDFAIIGEGEFAVIELCEAIQGKKSLGDIAGLVYRENGRIICNKERDILWNLDVLPFPDYEAFGIESIARYSIITSRGCAFNCSYCFRSSPKWRPRSAENIIDELKQAVEKYRIREFVIVDDSFNIDNKRVEKFCNLLETSGLEIPWSCTGVRADRLPESLILKLKKGGCRSICLGIETLQPDLYETLNRKMTMETVINCVKLLKKNKLSSYSYFLIGLPGETKEKTWDTYLKAKAMGIENPQFSLLLPFPGTRMHDAVYSIPGVRRLEDYRYISTGWAYSPEFSKMRVAFETPDYSAKEKVEMYNKLRTVIGDPRPPYHKSYIIFGIHAFLWILKYDFLHAPLTIYKLTRNSLRRLVKSRGKSLSLNVNTYQQAYLSELLRLVKQGERQRPPGFAGVASNLNVGKDN